VGCTTNGRARERHTCRRRADLNCLAWQTSGPNLLLAVRSRKQRILAAWVGSALSLPNFYDFARLPSMMLDLITTRTLQLRKLRSIGDILAEEPRGFAKDGSRVSPIIITSRQGRSGRSAVLNGPCVASASGCGLLANGPKGARRRLPTRVVFTGPQLSVRLQIAKRT
jgi:hypothetical protein